jgi:hypothetical protein
MDSKQFVPMHVSIMDSKQFVPMHVSIRDSKQFVPVHASILDSKQIAQVGGFLKYPPISPLSLWERVRVRGLLDQSAI